MAKVSTYYHQDYSGGLNDTASDGEIERNEASFVRNWDITKRATLFQRPGLTQTGDTLSNGVDGMGTFERTAGNDITMMEGGTMRYLNGTTWDALDNGFTASSKTFFETFPLNGKHYISNEDDNLHSWNRASVVLNSCLTDLGAAVPHGNVMRFHKNHMFHANNVTVSGTTYEHRLYWSDIGDADTYDTINDFAVVPGNGRLITMMDLGDELVLFKEHSIQFLSGWGDSDWRITASASNYANIDESIGISGPRALTKVGNEIWFMDDEGIIRRVLRTDFDAFRRDIISTKIRGTLDQINQSQIANVVATTYNDKVIFSVPLGASTTNNAHLVFDLLASRRTGEEAWTVYTGSGWEPSMWQVHFAGVTPDLYLGHVSNGKTYTHEGDDDDGVAIACRWDGKNDDYDKPARYKRYRFGYAVGPNLGDVDVEIHAAVDDAPFAYLGDLSLLGRGSRLGPTGSFLLGPTGDNVLGGGTSVTPFRYLFSSGGGAVVGRWLKMSIRHAVAGEEAAVNNFTNHYKLREVR